MYEYVCVCVHIITYTHTHTYTYYTYMYIHIYIHIYKYIYIYNTACMNMYGNMYIYIHIYIIYIHTYMYVIIFHRISFTLIPVLAMSQHLKKTRITTVRSEETASLPEVMDQELQLNGIMVMKVPILPTLKCCKSSLDNLHSASVNGAVSATNHVVSLAWRSQ